MSRTALIIGGTGGLGSAVTSAFVEAGWRVVVPWIVEAELKRVAEHPLVNSCTHTRLSSQSCRIATQQRNTAT